MMQSDVGWSKEGPEIIPTIPDTQGKKNIYTVLKKKS